MFTGIIEEIGKIKNVRRGAKSSVLIVNADKVINNTNVGDSISTNGVCLTVTKILSDGFEADVMAETLRRSNLGELKQGDAVNLERAILAGGRFGGHIVSGHVDGTGKITKLKKEDNAVWVYISASFDILKYIVFKGSVAIDGISLTVAEVGEDCFAVSVIPHTGEETILLSKKVGDIVNLENDIIAKYVEKLILPKDNVNKNLVTMESLIKNGFL